jgi:hypothetical protein
VIISGFEGLIEGGAQLLMVKKKTKERKEKKVTQANYTQNSSYKV